MKKIEVIMRSSRLEIVKNKLHTLGIHGMTVSEVSGFGRQRGHKEVYRGLTYEVKCIPKIKLEIYLNDDEVENVIQVVMETAKTGEVGDGKIFILPVENVIRIRTGEEGNTAL